MKVDDVIRAADNLIHTLDQVIENDRRICEDIKLILENYSWDIYRIKNNISEIKSYV